MTLTSLKFRPGINREITPFANEGGWVDGDKIRFREAFPETIGGWSLFNNQTFVGTARSLHPWAILSGKQLLSLGTNLKYYLVEGGQPLDITPIRLTTAAGTTAFAATTGSSVITITHTLHGARLNAFVTFSDAVSLGGDITADALNTELQITRVINTNSYEVDVGVAATASDTGDDRRGRCSHGLRHRKRRRVDSRGISNQPGPRHRDVRYRLGNWSMVARYVGFKLYDVGSHRAVAYMVTGQLRRRPHL
jgi:hypothetical protein